MRAETTVAASTAPGVPADDGQSHMDVHFRDGWRHWTSRLGDRAGSAAHRTTFCLLKPEVIVSRRVELALATLRDLGFDVRALRPVRLGRDAIKDVWYFDWPRLAIDFLDVMTYHFSSADCLLVGLVATDGSPAVASASARLSALKGATRSAERDPASLRARLGAREAPMTFVHVPDETTDCIRQLAVLLDPEALQDFLRASSRTPDAPDADAIARLYAKHPRHDLSPEASRERIAAAMASAPGQAAHLTARILDLSCGARAGLGPDPAALVSLVRRAPVRLDPWDVLTVIATSPAPA